MSRLTALLLAFLLTFPTALLAQDAAPVTCDVNVTGLQLWYMALDPDSDIGVQFVVAISSTTKVSDKFGALEKIRERAEEIADMEHPECMQPAVDWYLEGIDIFIGALEAFIDSDVSTFVSQQSQAMQLMGQFRGYVAAYGVELYETETGTIYTK